MTPSMPPPALQAAVDPLDFSGKYNTPIPAARQKEFDDWVARERLAGKDHLKDRYDYDVNGFYLSGAATAGNGHGSDKFKKPNHPTFSNESQYNGVDGYQGGQWGEGTYLPSHTNLKFRKPQELQQYFQQTEPDVKLILPAQHNDSLGGSMPPPSMQRSLQIPQR